MKKYILSEVHFAAEWTWKNLEKTVEPIFYIAISLIIGFFAGRIQRYRDSFQNAGEELLSKITLKKFSAPDYHLLNHITLPMADGTTQIDHILVSRFGIFVIETKNYGGWIFANSAHKFWTQVYFHRKNVFQNPIHQNYRHLRAVQSLLDFLPPSTVKSIVVFTGNAEFKTETPSEVFNISGFIQHVREQSTEILSANRMQFCVGRLETARLAITRKTDIQHVKHLQRRHGHIEH